MSTKPALDELFDRRVSYPDLEPQEWLRRLVGLDGHISRLKKILSLLVNPAGLDAWARKHHKNVNDLLAHVLKRPPLVVLAGDVGSGKTELAEAIGDAVARQEDIPITLFPRTPDVLNDDDGRMCFSGVHWRFEGPRAR